MSHFGSYQPVTILNALMAVLGTTTPSLWPCFESTGGLVAGLSVGDLIPSETAGALSVLETDFVPVEHPGKIHSYHFHPTGDHHLAGIDHNNFSFGNATVDTPFSCGAWICPNAIASNVVIAKYDSAGNKEEWKLWIDSNGKLALELQDASASDTETATGSTTLSLSQWVFVVATYDGTETAPVVNLYINAVLDNDGTTVESANTGPNFYVAMENTTAPLTVGCSGVTAAPINEFHGRIAMPFLTGKALSAAEVSQLYELGGVLMGV